MTMTQVKRWEVREPQVGTQIIQVQWGPLTNAVPDTFFDSRDRWHYHRLHKSNIDKNFRDGAHIWTVPSA